MEDKLEKLYNNISGEYDLPDLNTFKADMADPAKLGKLHQTLTQDNWELPDLQTFQRDMFPQKKKGLFARIAAAIKDGFAQYG